MPIKILLFLILVLITMIILYSLFRYNRHIIKGGSKQFVNPIKVIKAIKPMEVVKIGQTQYINNWPLTTIIPIEAVNMCKKIIKDKSQPIFGMLDINEKIKGKLAILNKKFHTNINIHTLWSMKNMESSVLRRQNAFYFSDSTKAKIIKLVNNSIQNGDKLSQIILESAERYRIPPMVILNYIAKHCPDIVPLMPEIKTAITTDDVSTPDAGTLMRKRSEEAELKLYNVMQKLNIDFVTEEELKREGSQFTPDVIFRKETYINDQRVYWIDIKDYMLYDSELNMESLRKQVAKYTMAFGQGALIFTGGVMERQKTFDNMNVILLDNIY